MASYIEVLGVLQDYRNALEQHIQQERGTQFSGDDALRTFAARGGVSAFSTPLTNVHATGAGIRVRNGEVIENDFVIKVYVFEKLQLENETPELTKSFNGIDVDVEPLPIQLALADNPRDRIRPITGGVSIAPLNESYVGTLGCFLQRFSGGTRRIFALSNNHVLADTNSLPVGTPIVQPGPEIAPTRREDVFATLSAYVPIQFPRMRLRPVVNSVDAAIAIVTNESLIETGSMLGVSNFTTRVGTAVPGMRVIKSGRTTGVTTGVVTATRVNGIQINYGTQTFPRIAVFNNTIEIINDDRSAPFSLPGDSGSVICDRATGRPVALLFAGDGQTTTACDFGTVCSQYQAFPI